MKEQSNLASACIEKVLFQKVRNRRLKIKICNKETYTNKITWVISKDVFQMIVL
jgi:hypothetical protein